MTSDPPPNDAFDGYAVAPHASSPKLPAGMSPDTTTDQTHSKRYLRRALFCLAIGAVVIGIVQFFAPDFDYQLAFLFCSVIGIATALLTLYNLQRAASQSGHVWWVPIATLVILGGFFSLVRVRTMSGEMVPQLGWRWAVPRVPDLQTTVLQTTVASDPTARVDADSSMDSDSAESIEPDSKASDGPEAASFVPAEQRSVASWSQFLGGQRDGVVDDRLFSVPKSADDVQTMWNIGIGEGWASFAVDANAVPGGIAVTLEQRDDLECVTAYRLSDGALLWIVEHDAKHYNALGQTGPRSTPTIHEGHVYAQGATGTVWCLDLQTGNEIWKVELLDVGDWDQIASESDVTWGRSGSPLLIDDLCILPLGAPENSAGRSLVALDTQNGAVRWKAGADQISYASAQVLNLAGKRQIVIVNEGTIAGHDIASGALLWQTDWPGQSNGGANCASVISAGENRFLVGKGYGGGSALIEISPGENDQTFECRDVWRSNRVMKTKFNHAVIRDSIAYGLSNGALQAIDIPSGKRLWEQPRRSRSGQGQVILAEDTLIVQEELGGVLFVAADPNEYRELFRLDALQHKTWNVPTLVGNVLLIRNAKQAMALRLPPR